MDAVFYFTKERNGICIEKKKGKLYHDGWDFKIPSISLSGTWQCIGWLRLEIEMHLSICVFFYTGLCFFFFLLGTGLCFFLSSKISPSQFQLYWLDSETATLQSTLSISCLWNIFLRLFTHEVSPPRRRFTPPTLRLFIPHLRVTWTSEFLCFPLATEESP